MTNDFETGFTVGMLMGGKKAKLVSKTVTKNGSYNASDDKCDGYNVVNVEVTKESLVTLTTKTITENGSYNASDDNCDGYDIVNVAVTKESLVKLIPKTITENGSYNASDDDCDGYDIVNVEVTKESLVDISELVVRTNGIYYATDYNKDGFDPVTVNVPTKDKQLEDLLLFISEFYPDEVADVGLLTGTSDASNMDLGDHQFNIRVELGDTSNDYTFREYFIVVSVDGEEIDRRRADALASTMYDAEGNPYIYGVNDISKLVKIEEITESNLILLTYYDYGMGPWQIVCTELKKYYSLTTGKPV